MTTVFFGLAENTEILFGCLQDSRTGSTDILHPVIIGGNTVGKIKRLGGFFFPKDLDRGFFRQVLCPVSSLFLHLTPRVTPFFQSTQWLLQRLGYRTFVNHSPAKIDNLIDILDPQRALLFTCAAGCT